MATAAYSDPAVLNAEHCPDPAKLANRALAKDEADFTFHKNVHSWIANLQARKWECRFGVVGSLPCPLRNPQCKLIGGLEFHVWRRVDNGCREVAIAFRGTDRNDLGDWQSNFRWLRRLTPQFDQYDQVRENIGMIVQRIEATGCNSPNVRFVAVGHSLGGGIVLQYAGVYPDKIDKVVAIEGLGPPPDMIQQQPKHAHERMQLWISQMRALAGRQARRYKTLDEAVKRMQETNPRLSAEQAYHLTVHGTNRNEDGTYTWKFDNYVRAQSPYRFNVDDAWQIWGRITCPTLLFRGAESWASDPIKDGRATALQNVKAVTIPNAGHWVHHDQPERVTRLLTDFFAPALPAQNR